MRLRAGHYWRKHLTGEVAKRLAAVACDADATISMLSNEPQPALTSFDRWIAFLTTPFKRCGIKGWKETGCVASARGLALRAAQHSTDGFWTIDVVLAEFSIGPSHADPGRNWYLRLELEPETAAHDVCARQGVGRGCPLAFGGAVVIDTDAEFLEIHPDRDFRIETLPGE